ncbi:sensor histidine kinase [Micromonospora sp. C28ISP2-4]|uniref:sensor histidine kinase n=1 Tax=Micromonospora sp. C28ISP2-4 TaxID=3059523 RepID=UPI002675B3C8|nr:histidine kinase [Micromonospora sp. C28ISP2-4]MDO3686664.1 histidine kinase [Micromonospora sp. C28ISP2-4]
MDTNALATGLSVASAFEGRRATIMATFRKRLLTVSGDLGLDQDQLDQVLTQAGQVLDDVTASLRTGEPEINEVRIGLAWQTSPGRTRAVIHPVDSLRAANELIEPVLDAVIETAAGLPDATCIFRTANQALQRSVLTRIRWSSESYLAFLLDRVQQAQMAERRRIARELHDRVGGPASVVNRNLQLAKRYAEVDLNRLQEKVEVAYEASVQSMDAVRGVATDLRLESEFDNLEQALRGFVEAMADGSAVVDLAISGDESWVPPEVLAELFLVVREALRNAFHHAGASTIVSHVDIAPHEVRAWVGDDGQGFDPTDVHGHGLTSMRERIDLLGGKLVLHTAPERGTHIEIFVPLLRKT